MSAYLNQVILIGRIGKKPEIAKTHDDKKIAKFSIATSEFWKDKTTGDRKEKTEWHRIVVYSTKIAEVIENYADEGMLVLVEGKISYEKWVDPNGQEKKTTNIIVDLNGKFAMLEKRGARGEKDSHSSSSSSDFESDDEIPF
jgi:single-strand DNA-binding protein